MWFGGRQCWTVYSIWLANLLVTWTNNRTAAASHATFSGSTRAGRPVLGHLPLPTPFLLLRTKPHSEWSSKRLVLLSRVFWLGYLENLIAEAGEGETESAGVPHGWASRLLSRVLQPWENGYTRVTWMGKDIQLGNQSRSQDRCCFPF